MNKPLVKLSNVNKYYHNEGIVALGLRNVNLEFYSGEIVAIVGPSGCGKTTLLNVISGVDSYEEGELFFNGAETSYFSQDDMDNYRKENVAFVFQNFNIIDSYSVLENVMVPLLLSGKSNKEAEEIALNLIKQVGLYERRYNKGLQLSGGEKQRCAIARALASDKPILACDEPTGHLDSKTGSEIIKLISEVAKDKLVLIVTHNEEQVSDIVTRVIRLNDGEVIEDSLKQDYIQSSFNNQSSINKTSASTILNIAARNIRNTPKKTVFSSLVLIMLSITYLFFFLGGLTLAEWNRSGLQSGFYNSIKNRIIVYNSDHSFIDEEKLSSIEGVQYSNAFYEDSRFIFNYYGHSIYASPTLYQDIEIDEKIGDLPKNENEVFFIFSGSRISFLNAGERIDLSNIYIGEDYNNYLEFDKSMICSGYAINENLYNNVCIMYNRETIDSIFSYSTVSSVSLRNKKHDTTPSGVVLNAAGKSKLFYYGPEEVGKSDIELNVLTMGIYSGNLPDDYDFSYVYNENESYKLYLGGDIVFNGIYEVSIYANNMPHAKSVITRAGYDYVVPTEVSPTYLSYAYFLYVFYTLITIFAGLVLTLVAYVILKRVYKTRIVDFTILRTLGFLQKDIFKIITIEMCVIGLLSSFIAFGLSFLTPFILEEAKLLLAYLNPFTTLLFILIIQGFSLILSRAFCKSLFKKTVKSTLNEGGVR